MERRLRPVALLVLLARAAPAGVVTADLVLVVLDDRLLLGDPAAVAGWGVPLDRGLGCDVRAGRGRHGRLAEGGGLLGGSARVVEAAGLNLGRELLLGARRDLDLDVED